MNKQSIFFHKRNKNLWFTSTVTLLGMALLIALVWFLKVPNPNMVLITGIIIFTSMFGRMAGVLSTLMIIIYSMYFFSMDHDFFTFTEVNIYKMMVILLSVIINTAIVAYLRYRWRNAQLELYELNGQLRHHNEQLQFQSKTDQLTGLYNRHALRENYDDYIGKQLTVAFMDVDNFKLINDTWGHDAGDEVLKILSSSMKEKLTNTTIYRYGGDEFLLIRDDVDIDLFEKQLDSVKKDLSSFNSSREGEKVNFSLGYVYGETKTSYDLRNMFEKADELLYDVKRHGKKKFIGSPYTG
ncbi:GGDEF domain-containing protein [Anaerovibrio sp. RM50]|uniref:GGDEF domain-containing protein n=1 Tax=Anaerovibrio sp. RM50 TaxID=1200557 RepID=UPI0004896D00|nr:GGDEF domain-containing protein [Anaerovibrio sp. RM50]